MLKREERRENWEKRVEKGGSEKESRLQKHLKAFVAVQQMKTTTTHTLSHTRTHARTHTLASAHNKTQHKH